MLGLVLVASAAVNAAPAYAAYHACVIGIVRQAAQEQDTPEDLPLFLRRLCRNEQAAFAREIVRRARRPDVPDRAAADAAEVESRTNREVNDAVRRYTIFYTTGLWPEK